MPLLSDIQEFEAPNIGRELTTGASPDAPEYCLPVFRKLDYVFVGRAPKARSVWIAGGLLADGTPVSGAGSDGRRALMRLCGEAAEQLAIRAPLPCNVADLPCADPFGPSDSPRVQAKSWKQGREVAIANTVLPHEGSGFSGFSEGLAAHPDRDRALYHAVQELIERDAVRRWWAGDHKGRELAGLGALMQNVLGKERVRATHLVDVTCRAGPAVVVATSFSECGGDFCFGAAARAGTKPAACAALREMAASEFGLDLANQRHDQGMGDPAGDVLRAGAVKLDALFENLVSANAHAEMSEIKDINWPELLADIDIYSIALTLRGTAIHAVKAISPVLIPGRGGNDNFGNGPFGVAIY